MYTADWNSLRNYEIPAWFKDAKLGLFIHWGAYAVPAWDNEWYPRFMYRDETARKGANYFRHHCRAWGHPGQFGYKDFIPRFQAERWDPEAWLDLFEAAGARYVVPVGEHHDGFPMYASRYTPWNAAVMGPRRDVVGELCAATRRRGLKFGVSSHRAFNWRYYTYRDDFDTADPAYAELYAPRHAEDEPAPRAWIEDWYARTQEMIDRFEPDVLWFDFGWQYDEFAPWRPQVCAYYYNQALQWGREVVLQYKDKLPDGVAVYDVERGKLDAIRPDYWQTDTAVSYKSWSYIENDEFKSAATLIHDLVDIVSKNGNLLLNVGPRADGVIPAEVAGLLRAVGAWLRVNGDGHLRHAALGTLRRRAHRRQRRPYDRTGQCPLHGRRHAFHAYVRRAVRHSHGLAWPPGDRAFADARSLAARPHRRRIHAGPGRAVGLAAVGAGPSGGAADAAPGLRTCLRLEAGLGRALGTAAKAAPAAGRPRLWISGRPSPATSLHA